MPLRIIQYLFWNGVVGKNFITNTNLFFTEVVAQTFDATVENMLNYRWDMVYANCENEDGENYWITDPLIYFEEKARMDADDHKQGRNQWLENYLRIKSRREVLLYTIVKSSENLDYDIQELIKGEWCDVKDDVIDWDVQEPVSDEEYSVEEDGDLDELPF